MNRRLSSAVAVSIACWTASLRAEDAAPPIAAPAEEERSSLREPGIEIAGVREIDAIEIQGLQTIREQELWSQVDRPATPFAFAQAAALVEALERTEAFARAEPRLRVGDSGRLTLILQLQEHPRVSSIALTGLAEFPEPEALGEVLGAAGPPWFARAGEDGVQPGILRGGPAGAVRRLLARLFESGYSMARVGAHLPDDGSLRIEVDEGRIDEIRLVGTVARQRPAVLESLQLSQGAIFNEADVRDALARLQRSLPSLRPDDTPRPTRALPTAVVTPDGSGGLRVALVETAPEAGPGAFAVDGGQLTLYFRPKLAFRFRSSIDEILRHTPVGGIGTGVITSWSLFDGKDRVHLQFDTLLGQMDGSVAPRLGEEDGGEYDIALRCRIPAWRIAELAVSNHRLLDTPDAWRSGRQTSYLNSLLFDRPDREYYGRVGSTVSLTLQPSPRLLVGFEEHVDTHTSLPSLENPPSIWSPDPRFHNPPVEDGDMGSVLFRAELHSEPVLPDEMRFLMRTPETSIVALPRSRTQRTGYQLLATLETARPGIEGNGRFRFTRLVSDNMAYLATGPDSGLRLRLRAAGGSGLPLQKQEALGGWSALRGYEFKEFRGGDWSLLTSVEYRQEWLSGFLDVGALHRPDGWTGPHAGAGLKLHFDSLPLVGHWLRNKRFVPPFQLAVAWRLDGGATIEPSVRLLVGQLF